MDIRKGIYGLATMLALAGGVTGADPVKEDHSVLRDYKVLPAPDFSYADKVSKFIDKYNKGENHYEELPGPELNAPEKLPSPETRGDSKKTLEDKAKDSVSKNLEGSGWMGKEKPTFEQWYDQAGNLNIVFNQEDYTQHTKINTDGSINIYKNGYNNVTNFRKDGFVEVIINGKRNVLPKKQVIKSRNAVGNEVIMRFKQRLFSPYGRWEVKEVDKNNNSLEGRVGIPSPSYQPNPRRDIKLRVSPWPN